MVQASLKNSQIAKEMAESVYRRDTVQLKGEEDVELQIQEKYLTELMEIKMSYNLMQDKVEEFLL